MKIFLTKIGMNFSDKIKKQFTIQYGIRNQDPAIEKQEAIKAMREGVDEEI